MTSGTDPVPTPAPNRPVQAETITTGVLVVASGIVFYLCYLVVLPFMPALAWALALAVIAHPAHRWLDQRMKSKSLCAGLIVAAMTLLLLVPAGFVTGSLVNQATRYAGMVQKGISSGRWEKQLRDNRYIGPLIERLSDLSKKPNGSAEGEKKAERGDSQEPMTRAAAAHGAPPSGDQTSNEASSINDRPAREPASGGLNWSPFELPSSSSLAKAAGAVTARVGVFVSGLVWIGMQLGITIMCLFFF